MTTSDLRKLHDERVEGIREEWTLDMSTVDGKAGAVLISAGELEWVILVTGSEGDEGLDLELHGFCRERKVGQSRTLTLRKKPLRKS
jgi:hypothetical protein